jgi:hypothetical protein
MDYFPNNTLASFTTRLPEMLDLDGSWEIGLAEIQFSLSNPRNDFNNGLMITCDKSLTHNVALWSTSLIPKLNPFFRVEPKMVGDAQVPLLRIVPVAGRDGEMMTRAFDHIQYCLLVLRRFQTVEIDIRDDTGVKIPFERYFLVHVLSDNVFQRTRDIPFLSDSSSTRDTL